MFFSSSTCPMVQTDVSLPYSPIFKKEKPKPKVYPSTNSVREEHFVYALASSSAVSAALPATSAPSTLPQRVSTMIPVTW